VKPRHVYIFFALACGITWTLDFPYWWAAIRHQEPPAYALPMTGLGALGPTIAAFIVGVWQRQLGSIFGRWRTNPLWIVAALFAAMTAHSIANLIEVALGGRPAQWFYPPIAPERRVALVFFSVGEEFGWRGLAYPKLADTRGPVFAAFVTGAVWGIWHLGMMWTPKPPDAFMWLMLVELIFWSFAFAWMYERSGRSIAVAIAMHMGAHLDNTNTAPEHEIRLRVLRVVVSVVIGAFAARSLWRSRQPSAGLAKA
jgi:membrane protease YdiL (CAAX protease family)